MLKVSGPLLPSPPAPRATGRTHLAHLHDSGGGMALAPSTIGFSSSAGGESWHLLGQASTPHPTLQVAWAGCGFQKL
jgi:hypothetical protein